ncbi:helix-turn-helix transcriptional regulator [Actinosynnema sp. NPDC002837]
MSRRDTVALKWLLGATLRNHRKAARKTLEHSAAHLGVSESKISNMESGRYGQPPEEVAKLLAFYGADPGRVERIIALAEADDTGSWWAPWSGVIPNWLRLFAGLEGMAESAFVYSPLFVHALLQTEDYATAVASSARRVRPVDMDRMVAFRMERQRRLTADANPLKLHFVIEESALLRPIGGKDVLRRQAEHLLEATRLPTVDIQVIEARVGMHPGLTGEFTLFGFEEFDETVYVELQEDAVYLNDSAKVRAYSMTAKTLRDIALDPPESAALITSLIRAL